MSRFSTRAGARLAELAELATEAGRLSRGRALFRKGSVSDLFVTEGSVIASVRGSKGDDYETSVRAALASPGVRRQVADGRRDRRDVDDLIDDGVDVCPREIDLAFACDCADWDEPCKHAAAVLLALADRVDLDEAELLRWRGIELSDGPGTAPAEERSGDRRSANEEPGSEERQVRTRSATGPRMSTPPTSPGSGAVTDPDDRTARLSRLESLLGDTVMRASAIDGAEIEPAPSALAPALAEFLGVGQELDPVDLHGAPDVAPLFAGIELGPLADLGPELATALAIITARLEDTSP